MTDEILHPDKPEDEAPSAAGEALSQAQPQPQPQPQSETSPQAPPRADAQDSATPFILEPKPIPPAPEPKRPTQEKEEASQSPFSITVGQVYDGPLDLLLDLIRKQNIDI